MEKTGLTVFLKDKVTKGLSRIQNIGTKTFNRVESANDKFNRGLVKTGKNIDKNRTKLSMLNKEGKQSNAIFSRMGGIMAGLAAGVGVGMLGQQIVETTGKFERFEAVLTNTFGAKGKAQQSIQQIVDFAASTPFEVDELTSSFVKLANRGMAPNLTQMTKMGDLASSVGKSYDQLTEAIMDATTGEFERLKEFGIRAKRQGKQVQFTFKGVTKTVALTDKSIQGYLESLGDVKGVQGAMAAISKTLEGRISNLKDKFTQFQLSIGQKLRPIMTKVIDLMNSLIDRGGKLVDWAAKNKDVLIPLVKWLGIVAGALSAVGAAMWLLSVNPFTLIVAGVVALVGGLIVAYKRVEWFRRLIDGFVSGLSPFIEMVKNSFLELRDTITKAFGDSEMKMTGFLNVLKFLFAVSLKIMQKNIEWILKLVDSVIQAINWFAQLGITLSGWFKDINTWMTETINKFLNMNESLKAIVETIGGWFKSVFSGISGFIDKILSKLGLAPGGQGLLKGGVTVTQTQQEKGNGVLSKIASGITGKRHQSTVSPALGTAAGVSNVTGDARATRNVSISINNLVNEINFNTTNIKESMADMTEQVKQVLLTSVNDVSLATQ